MRARRILSLCAALIVLSAMAGAAPAHSKPSHSLRFDSFRLTVGCGVQLKELGGMSCFSDGLPSTELDGYVELHAHGSPKIGERGDSPWRGGTSTTHLRREDRWGRVGVKCVLHKVLRCTNLDGNGFTLTPKAYALF